MRYLIGNALGAEVKKNLEIDHVIPKAKGGRDSIENLQLLCQKCNREKGTSISL